MKRLMLCLLLAATAGCASQPVDVIQVARPHEVDLPTLTRICSSGKRLDPDPKLSGCYRWKGDVLHIYVLPQWVHTARADFDEYLKTLGEELHHGFEGDFHGSHRGVPIPAGGSHRTIKPRH